MRTRRTQPAPNLKSIFVRSGIFIFALLGSLGCTKTDQKKGEPAAQQRPCEYAEKQLDGTKVIGGSNLTQCLQVGQFYYMSGIQSSKTNSLATWGPFEVKVESKDSQEILAKVYSTSSNAGDKADLMEIKIKPGQRLSFNKESAHIVFSKEIPTKKKELNQRKFGHVKLPSNTIGEAYIRAIQPSQGESSLNGLLESVKRGTYHIKTPPGELAFSTVSRHLIGGATLLVVGEERHFLVGTYFALDPTTNKPSGKPEFFYIKKEDFQIGPLKSTPSNLGSPHAATQSRPNGLTNKIEGLSTEGVEIHEEDLDLWLDKGDSESLSAVEPTLGFFAKNNSAASNSSSFGRSTQNVTGNEIVESFKLEAPDNIVMTLNLNSISSLDTSILKIGFCSKVKVDTKGTGYSCRTITFLGLDCLKSNDLKSCAFDFQGSDYAFEKLDKSKLSLRMSLCMIMESREANSIVLKPDYLFLRVLSWPTDYSTNQTYIEPTTHEDFDLSEKLKSWKGCEKSDSPK